MSSTSIDDLLSFSEEDRSVQPEQRPAGRVRSVATFLGVAAASTVVLVAGLRAVGLRVSLLVLVAAVVTLLLVRRIVVLLAPPPKPPRSTSGSGGEEDGMYNWDARDALRAAINGWEMPLEWTKSRPERFTTLVLPRLAELADERLRLKHGVTRESDPTRARALLGDRLWMFLETPPRRTPSPRDLAVIVAELEKI
ncbi:hypothetical protein GCM10009541_28240 [Micromonospora gifhornensis]|uniref:DUF4129 domain-containing protein n=1 Tax=Micromonospora gifhornensis TaxID=84594 RepID=A0ABQ4I851_9ACTN|nr:MULTISPECIES: hypothetical protein [Micromonospora]PMR62218.1 hypothetical protein C1A38_04295 [Verrucosispora sp. ts21]GIJ14056.1 hypothetical protein Vgi01_07400 [Micromonospora gifhornensis]